MLRLFSKKVYLWRVVLGPQLSNWVEIFLSLFDMPLLHRTYRVCSGRSEGRFLVFWRKSSDGSREVEFLQNSPKCQARTIPIASIASSKFIMGMCLYIRRVLIGELTGQDLEDNVFSCSLVSSFAAPIQTPRHYMSFLSILASLNQKICQPHHPSTLPSM